MVKAYNAQRGLNVISFICFWHFLVVKTPHTKEQGDFLILSYTKCKNNIEKLGGGG